MNSVVETLVKRVKDLSSLNNTLYEKNNSYVKKLFCLRQYLQDKFPGLAEKVFKTEYLGEWKNDDGRD